MEKTNANARIPRANGDQNGSASAGISAAKGTEVAFGCGQRETLELEMFGNIFRVLKNVFLDFGKKN